MIKNNLKINSLETNRYSKITFLYQLKMILFYFFIFLLLYIEPIAIGGIKISILWKILLLATISLPIIINIATKKRIEPFVFFAILLSIKMLFSISSFEYFNITIGIVAKNLLLPMLFLFFVLKFTSEQLIFFAKHFSILIILSFVPFILGILEPMSEGYALVGFGLKDSFGLIGVFQKAHAASETLGTVLIVLFYFFQNEKNKYMKLMFVGLLGLGVYELILTYARAGMLIAFIGMFYLWIKEKGSKKYITAIMLIVPIVFMSIYMYSTDPVFQMRINDENAYNKNKDMGSDRIGSGRLKYAETALNNWYEEGLTSHIMGLGMGYGLIKMEQAIGSPIFAHNGYIQILQQEGLIGLFLFLLYLFSLLKYIYNRKANMYYKISMAIVLGYLTEMLVQGNFVFALDVLIAAFLALMKKSETEKEWF